MTTLYVAVPQGTRITKISGAESSELNVDKFKRKIKSTNGI